MIKYISLPYREATKLDATRNNVEVGDNLVFVDEAISSTEEPGDHIDARDVALAAVGSKACVRAGYFVSYFHKVSTPGCKRQCCVINTDPYFSGTQGRISNVKSHPGDWKMSSYA